MYALSLLLTPVPAGGEMSPWHRRWQQRQASGDESNRHKQSVAARLTGSRRQKFLDRVEAYVNRLLDNGRYPLDEEKVGHARNIIELCRDADVPIVLFEVPLPDVLIEHLPQGTREAFLTTTRQLAREEGVAFLLQTE